MGNRTIVCKLQSSINFSLIRALMFSPNKNPSGKTKAALPPTFNSCIIKTKNRSAVSLVLKVAGKFVSIPSSSFPPNGGFVITVSYWR